jgi:hypothetical protein
VGESRCKARSLANVVKVSRVAFVPEKPRNRCTVARVGVMIRRGRGAVRHDNTLDIMQELTGIARARAIYRVLREVQVS